MVKEKDIPIILSKGKIEIFGAVIIFILTFLVYINSLDNSFHYDDYSFIVENPYVRDVTNIPRFFTHPEMFSGRGTKMYRPLLLVTYVINYKLGGYDVFGYHVVNILFHAINTILVFFIASLLLNKCNDRSPHSAGFYPAQWSYHSLAFFAGLIFGLHALNTQAVNWISSRSVLLVSFFYLGALYFYTRSEYRHQTSDIRNKENLASGIWHLASGYYLLSIFFYSCALFSKEIAITLPLILLLYDITLRNGSTTNTIHDSRFTIHDLIRHLPFWGISLGYLLVRKVLLGRAILKISEGTLTIEEIGASRGIYVNLLTQAKAIVFYIKSLFLPTGLSIEHGMGEASGIGEPGVMGSLLVIFFILSLAGILLKNRKEISFSILWFFIVLLPETLLPLKLIINEHRAYLPGVGFALMVVFVFQTLRLKLQGKRSMVVLVGFIVLFISLNGYETIKRNQVWRDDYTLWKDAVSKAPLEARPYVNLGTAYKDRGLIDEAIEEFKTALRLEPDDLEAHTNLGYVYIKKGLLEEAIEELKIALRISPIYPIAYNNLGLAYSKKGLFDKAVKELKTALMFKHDYPEARRNLAMVHLSLAATYHEQGLLDEALEEYKSAVKLNPNLAEVYVEMGVVYGEKGLLEDALEEFKTAIRIRPDYSEAHNNLGNIYLTQRKFSLAIKEYEEALSLNPDNVVAYYNLAMAYEGVGSREAALKYYSRFIDIAPLEEHQLTIERAKRRLKKLR